MIFMTVNLSERFGKVFEMEKKRREQRESQKRNLIDSDSSWEERLAFIKSVPKSEQYLVWYEFAILQPILTAYRSSDESF